MQDLHEHKPANTPAASGMAFRLVSGIALGAVAVYSATAMHGAPMLAANAVSKAAGVPPQRVMMFGNTATGFLTLGTAATGAGLLGSAADSVGKDNR